MTTLLVKPPIVSPAALIELRTLLRLETVEEDALLAGYLRSALERAEDFTDTSWLVAGYQEIRRPAREIALRKRPFKTLDSVSAQVPGGSAPVLASVQCSDHGEAMLTLLNVPDDASQLVIHYDAGQCSDWAFLPESLRHGVLTMAAHLFNCRDGGAALNVPLAVSSLWLPYKSLRLM
jgi:uncharacterized phiE125 gp8 family phage protein